VVVWNAADPDGTLSERLVSRRDELAAANMGLLTQIDSERRDLSEDEARLIDERSSEVDRIDGQLRVLGRVDAQAPRRAGLGRRTTPEGPNGRSGSGGQAGIGVVIGTARDGQEIRALRPHEKLCDQWRGELPGGVRPHDLSLGRWVQGMVTHRWDHAPAEEAAQIRAAQSGSSDPAGGFVVPGPIALPFIDLARSQARVIEAGALVVNLNAPAGFYGKLTGDPTLTWRPENALVPASQLTFGRINIVPKTVAGRVLASVEWLEDVPNGAQLIDSALSAKLANELDRVCLYGNGANEPAGLKSAAWTPQTITGVGTPADYDDFSSAVQKILTANGPTPDKLAALLSPRDWGTLDRLRTTDDLVFAKPQSVQELRLLPTTQVAVTEGAGGAESSVFVGDWSQMVIVIRTDVTVEVSRESGGSSDEGWNSLQVQIRAYLRMDVGVLRDNHFVILSGVTA
jgi:HK97 family phage major capsid protein